MINEQQINALLHTTATNYPRAWQHAHHEGDPERYDFIIIAGKYLSMASGGDIGCNWRRGVQGDLSMDGISVLIDGQWRFADVIGGAGGSNPTIGYRTPGPEAALRNSSGAYIGIAGVADPVPLKTHYPYGAPQPVDPNPAPPPPPPPPTVVIPSYESLGGDAVFDVIGAELEADLKRAGQALNPQSGRWFGRTVYDALVDAIKNKTAGQTAIEASLAKHKAEWRAILGL